MVDVLRTPGERFDALDDWPHEPVFTDVEVDGTPLRMARVDLGPVDAHPVLLLHGEPTWGYLWRDVLPPLLAAGHRVVAPDLVGFGRSDKPGDRTWFDYDRMAATLDQHLEAAVGGGPVTLVVHDWGGMLGLPWATRHADRVERLVILNTFLYRGTPRVSDAWQGFHDFIVASDELEVGRLVGGGSATELDEATIRGLDAPFPDASYQGGALALPPMVVRSDDMPGATQHLEAWDALGLWTAPTLVVWGRHDQAIPPLVAEQFAAHIPDVTGPELVDADHFLQLDVGRALGERIASFIAETRDA